MWPARGWLCGLVLLTGLSSPGEAQDRRVFCVVVDDTRFVQSDRENAARLLAVIRDEVLREGDLVGLASTGPSSMAADLQPASDRRILGEAVAKIIYGPSVASGTPNGEAQSQLLHTTHIGLATAADITRNLAQLDHPQKYLILITSGAAAATSLEAVMVGTQPPSDTPQADSVTAATIARDIADLAATARGGNVTIRAMSASDPMSAALLRALR